MTGLIIDNFAGGGGASTGIEQAMGRPVDIAINHDPVAMAMHKANHPHTRHLCEDVFAVNPVEVCAGRPVDLAWFSPDCTHHSKARGCKPVKKKIRGLAWVVLRWTATVKPRVFMLENVEEFMEWGPTVKHDNGNEYPCPQRKGRTFKAFTNALKRQGYDVEHRILRACDYGAPTIRKRLFLVARCDGRPIVWPEPTHGDPKTEAVKSGRLKPWRTAAECIDWSIPCPSIFERKKPLAEATLRRIAKGIMKYVVNAAEPFIVRTDMHKSNAGCFYDINDPLRTVTSTGGHAVVVPTLIQTGYGERKGQSPRVPGLEKPLGTVVAGGSKHALVSAFLAKHYTGAVGQKVEKPVGTVTGIDHVRHMGQSVGQDLNDPARTVTIKSKDSLVTSHLVKLRGTCRHGQPVTTPISTVTAGGLHIGEVRAFLLKYYGNEADGVSLKEPMHTVTGKDRFGLVIVKGVEYQIVDIGMRMLTPRELFRAQGFPDGYVIDRDVDGKPLTKTEQVAKCGNSVCPDVAAALVRANVSASHRLDRQEDIKRHH